MKPSHSAAWRLLALTLLLGGCCNHAESDSRIDLMEGGDVDDAGRQPSSAIIIDLDRDGKVETTALSGSRIHFDHNRNGFAEQSGWVGRDDGLLVLDLNGNGKIDHGGELFGNQTLLADGSTAANGFEALKQYDSNGNGRLDAGDARWGEFRIWQDSNQNGLAEEGELRGLDAVGLASLNLTYRHQSVKDEHGHSHTQLGSVSWTDGGTSAATDVWFQVNTGLSVYQRETPVSQEIAALPEVMAFGRVYSLHDAMSRDAVLLDLVKTYVAAEQPTAAQLEALICRWTGVDQVSGSRGGHIDARKLAALEVLTDKDFHQVNGWGANPGPQAAAILNQEFDKFANYVAAKISWQTDYREAAAQVAAYKNADGSLVFDWTGLKLYLYCLEKTDGMEAVSKVMKTQLAALSYADSVAGHLRTEMDGFAKLVWPQEKSWEFFGLMSPFSGTEGQDSLMGDAADNILFGGSGNDTLNGGEGSDTYVFVKQFGRDTINNYDAGGDRHDVIRFADRVQQDFLITRLNNDLLITTKEGDNRVTVSGYFNLDGNHHYRIDEIVFADGSKLDVAAVKVLVQQGSETANSLYAYASGSTLRGLGGNDCLYGAVGTDILYGGNGNDRLEGGAGDDRLFGGNEDDVLIGDAGNDTLTGGKGNDIYVFAKGHGRDTVRDYAVGQGTDTFRLLGIKLAETELHQSGSDLVLKGYHAGDSVRIRSFFRGKNHRVEQLLFDDYALFADDIAQFAKRSNGLIDAMSASGSDNGVAVADLPEYQKIMQTLSVACQAAGVHKGYLKAFR